MAVTNFIISPSEHVTIVGKTGSGKTYFAQHMLLNPKVERLIVLDPKANLKERFRLETPSPKVWRRYHNGDPVRIQIKPPKGTVEDQYAFYEEVFQDIYETQDTFVYIDEVYRVTPQNAGYWLTSVYTQGRELFISMWCTTQRPARIPQFILSEPEWYVMFRLNKKDDRQRLAEMMGEEAMTRIPDPHGLYLYNVNWDNPRYYASLNVVPLRNREIA